MLLALRTQSLSHPLRPAPAVAGSASPVLETIREASSASLPSMPSMPSAAAAEGGEPAAAPRTGLDEEDAALLRGSGAAGASLLHGDGCGCGAASEPELPARPGWIILGRLMTSSSNYEGPDWTSSFWAAEEQGQPGGCCAAVTLPEAACSSTAEDPAPAAFPTAAYAYTRSSGAGAVAHARPGSSPARRPPPTWSSEGEGPDPLAAMYARGQRQRQAAEDK